MSLVGWNDTRAVHATYFTSLDFLCCSQEACSPLSKGLPRIFMIGKNDKEGDMPQMVGSEHAIKIAILQVLVYKYENPGPNKQPLETDSIMESVESYNNFPQW